MKVRKIIILPLILSIIFSSNWANDIATYMRRGLAILTLGMILWFIYEHLKEPDLAGRNIIVLSVIVVTSVLLVIGTLLNTGW
jgi:hypothetical protein